jgi:hypothetical protein
MRRVLISGVWSQFFGMTGRILSVAPDKRLVLLDEIPNYPMVFLMREVQVLPA